MSRLARLTIATIVGLQLIFWVAAILWMYFGPQST
jgi:hypothetical protein